jgi:adenylosuccinate synthase
VTATAIVGAQFGSEGKGAVVAALADHFDAAVRTGGPNAGHSFVHGGKLYKMRQLPCIWTNPRAVLMFGAGGTLDLEVLEREILDTGVDRSRMLIDRAAVIITEKDREAEEHSSLTRMGSTLEGVGAARIHKILRDVDSSPLAGHRLGAQATADTVQILWEMLNRGQHVLLEGTQGSGLSLHHGLWPHVTSNDTNAAQLLADAGIAPGWLAHTLLVARSYPIRVGGPSGPMPGGELTFDQIPGAPIPERTTVTNKVRRISGWEDRVFNRAVQLNDPCGIALTFIDYIDPTLAGVTDPDYIMASKKARDFIEMVEYQARTPVVIVGTGGPAFQMVPLRDCKHGKRWETNGN